MEYLVKHNSGTHKNWLLLRDTVIGGLKYSWARLPEDVGEYLRISIDSNLANPEHTHAWASSGIEVTTGHLVTATQMIEILGEDKFKEFIGYVLTEEYSTGALENVFRLGDICLMFTWSDDRLEWANLADSLDTIPITSVTGIYN